MKFDLTELNMNYKYSKSRQTLIISPQIPGGSIFVGYANVGVPFRIVPISHFSEVISLTGLKAEAVSYTVRWLQCDII